MSWLVSPSKAPSKKTKYILASSERLKYERSGSIIAFKIADFLVPFLPTNKENIIIGSSQLRVESAATKELDPIRRQTTGNNTVNTAIGSTPKDTARDKQ